MPRHVWCECRQVTIAFYQNQSSTEMLVCHHERIGAMNQWAVNGRTDVLSRNREREEMTVPRAFERMVIEGKSNVSGWDVAGTASGERWRMQNSRSRRTVTYSTGNRGADEFTQLCSYTLPFFDPLEFFGHETTRFLEDRVQCASLERTSLYFDRFNTKA